MKINTIKAQVRVAQKIHNCGNGMEKNLYMES